MNPEKITEWLSFNSNTGTFYWKKKPNRKIVVGQEAGCSSRGYRVIRLEGTLYGAHQLAWCMYYGKWQKNVIDHINGIPSDNRKENLRDVPQGINRANQHKPSTKSTTGYVGVSRSGNRFSARYKNKHLGQFSTAEVAHKRYMEERANAL